MSNSYLNFARKVKVMNNNFDKITILLATYNGEKYIQKQIDSIINQTYKNWDLWIRDDGSKDNTIDLLYKYEEKDTRIHVLDNDNKFNLGPCMNFNELCVNVELSEYIMFSDQDDVWLPDKIEKTYNYFKSLERKNDKNKPILVFTDFIITDGDLKVVEESGYKFIDVGSDFFNKPLNSLLAFNFVWGCTTLCNRTLLNKCTPIPKYAENHDYWIGLVASIIGKLYFMNETTMYYRQHSNNVTGVYETAKFKNRVKKLFMGWEKFNKKISNSIYHANELKHRYENEISEHDLYILENYMKLSTNTRFKIIKFVLKNDIKRASLIQNVVFCITLFFYKEN
jgi:rhamnosyltransferase